MGNFVSSSCPHPSTTPSPLLQPTSQHKGRCVLTSALAAHATPLANLFRSFNIPGYRDIEAGLSPPSDHHGEEEDDMPTGRRRALLIGIAYHGELLNTHKDVDRYRDLLLGTVRTPLSMFLFYFPHWFFYCLLLCFCCLIVSQSFCLLTRQTRHIWVLG